MTNCDHKRVPSLYVHVLLIFRVEIVWFQLINLGGTPFHTCFISRRVWRSVRGYVLVQNYFHDPAIFHSTFDDDDWFYVPFKII